MSGRRFHRPVAMGAAILLACAAGLAPAAPLRADAIVLSDGREIQGVQFQVIRQATLYYLEQGQIRQIDAADVDRLKFDAIPELDDAERELARDDLDDALDKLLIALGKANSEPQRLWLHARLAQVHDALGDFIEAAGHAGAVIAIDPSPYWAKLKPEAEINEATWHSAAEARHHLLRASRSTEDPQLIAVIDELLAAIDPLYDAQRALHPRREYRDGSTISGIPIADLAAGWPDRNRGEKPPRSTGQDEEGGQIIVHPPRGPDEDRGGGAEGDPDTEDNEGDSSDAGGRSWENSPRRIDELLEEGRHEEALAVCERIAADPDDRDLGEFLYQFGRALAGAGRKEDAAVRFMQCAAHFGGSRYAIMSRLETGLIYRDDYRRPAIARALIERALDEALAIELMETAERAREALGEEGSDGATERRSDEGGEEGT